MRAVVDSTLYALGRRVEAGGIAQFRVDAYSTQKHKWSAAGQLVHAVHQAACVSYNNFIYVFGGKDVNYDAVAHVQVYDAA